MSKPSLTAPRRGQSIQGAPSFIYHESFAESDAEDRYSRASVVGERPALGYLPDEATHDYTRRMHYAAWRISVARNRREANRWRRRHLECRDRIVLGNRKLTFRAVRKWGPALQLADDMAAECQIVLIKAVSAFNPWLGIRFSTYAFTCLMRALSRLSKRHAADRLAHALPLETMPNGGPGYAAPDLLSDVGGSLLRQYFGEDHCLLTPREKAVLARRYRLFDGHGKTETLEQVGRDLGLSKERVRQVQLSALAKLRAALLAAEKPV